MRLVLDLGDETNQEWLDVHLSKRALGIDDIVGAAQYLVVRRKGERLYGYGRGSNDQPIVVVFRRTSGGWRPVTAWQMDDTEERWWRKHGGR